MTDIKLKRVYEPAEKSDGYRIFVDRMWPRGMKKESFHYDLWAKGITPSPELRKWFHSDVDGRWEGFKELYQRELSTSDNSRSFIEEIEKHKTVTLLYSAKDTKHTHALILKEYAEKNM